MPFAINSVFQTFSMLGYKDIPQYFFIHMLKTITWIYHNLLNESLISGYLILTSFCYYKQCCAKLPCTYFLNIFYSRDVRFITRRMYGLLLGQRLCGILIWGLWNGSIRNCINFFCFLTTFSFLGASNLIDRIIVPQRCSCSNPKNLWICYFTWQKGLCRCDQVKDHEMRNCLGLSRWAPCNHKGPYKWKEQKRRIEEGRSDCTDVDAGWGPWVKECRQPLEPEKGKDTNSSLKPPKGTQFCQDEL